MSMDYFKYLRKERMPHIWCPGCGHGMVMKSILRGLAKLDVDPNDVCVVSGIGCSSRTPGYLDFNTLHTTHGRALPFATGVKLTRPDMKVIVVSGDGDAMAIGGNHFIHSCRRNIDITLVVFNNYIYGMTGGQVSPTTPTGQRGTTAPHGSIEQPFNVTDLAIGSGATYVGRALDVDSVAMDRVILNAMKHKGFSVVDAWSQCPTYFGRQNRLGTATQMMEQYKEVTYNVRLANKLTDEEKKGKFPVGELHKKERPEYCEEYQMLMHRLGAKA